MRLVNHVTAHAQLWNIYLQRNFLKMKLSYTIFSYVFHLKRKNQVRKERNLLFWGPCSEIVKNLVHQDNLLKLMIFLILCTCLLVIVNKDLLITLWTIMCTKNIVQLNRVYQTWIIIKTFRHVNKPLLPRNIYLPKKRKINRYSPIGMIQRTLFSNLPSCSIILEILQKLLDKSTIN